MKKNYTIKVFKIRNRKYIGVWKKKHTGFYALFKYSRKEHKTKKSVQQLMKIEKKERETTAGYLEQQIKEKKYLYRSSYTRIFTYKEDVRIGQLRIEAFSYNPKKFTKKVMAKFWDVAFNILLSNPRFYSLIHRYKVDICMPAYENRIISKDEMRGRKINTVYGDFVGFGMNNTYSFVVAHKK